MVKRTDRPAMTIAVDMGRKATKTNKQKLYIDFNLSTCARETGLS